MSKRRAALASSVLVVASIVGCDSAGCSKTSAGVVSGKDWSVTVACESSTRLGGIGAGHAGGILYPDGCDVDWSVRARSRSHSVDERIDGLTPYAHECSKTKAFCKEAKVDTAQWADGEDVKVAVSAGGKAYVFYIMQPGRPFSWPREGAPDDVLAVQSAGDAKKLLTIAPAPDDILTQMLSTGIALTGGVEDALTGPRLVRHLSEVKAAIDHCTLSEPSLDVVTKTHAEIPNDAYSGWARDPDKCDRYAKWLAQAKQPAAIAERLDRDLAACDATCEPRRLEGLAIMTGGFGSAHAVSLLVPHLHAPTRDEWLASDSHAYQAFAAWHAAAVVVVQRDAPSARTALMADFERTSTVPLPAPPHVSYVPEPLSDDDAGTDEADGGAEPEDTASATDAGDDAGAPDEGVRLGELLPGFGKRKLDAPPDFSMTAVDIARLLYLVDDRSVHDRMYALAQDPKRDRGLRQVAIGYLAYKYDKRARDLVESDVLTPDQRTEVKRVVFGPPPSDASAPPPAPAPGRRRHHRHL